MLLITELYKSRRKENFGAKCVEIIQWLAISKSGPHEKNKTEQELKGLHLTTLKLYLQVCQVALNCRKLSQHTHQCLLIRSFPFPSIASPTFGLLLHPTLPILLEQIGQHPVLGITVPSTRKHQKGPYPYWVTVVGDVQATVGLLGTLDSFSKAVGRPILLVLASRVVIVIFVWESWLNEGTHAFKFNIQQNDCPAQWITCNLLLHQSPARVELREYVEKMGCKHVCRHEESEQKGIRE